MGYPHRIFPPYFHTDSVSSFPMQDRKFSPNAKVRSMKKLSLVPVLFVAASLTACSGPFTKDEQPTTVNNASTSTAASIEKPTPTASENAPQGSAAPEPTQPLASDNDQQPEAQQQSQQAYSGSQKDQLNKILRENYNPGDQVTINGGPATLCMRGDGYGTNMLAAGPNTSCDFAKAVMSKQISQRNATYDDIRNSLSPSISVKSPVTNENYTMQCSVDADKLITCAGGNNASVFMY